MTALIAMPHFQDTFHSGTDGPQVSVIFSLYTVGAMVGAPGAAVLADRYGRRKGMFVGAIVIILGMVIAATSKTVAQLVVARFILGVGIAIMTVGAPAYAVEIAPPHWRGRMTGIYNCGEQPHIQVLPAPADVYRLLWRLYSRRSDHLRH